MKFNKIVLSLALLLVAGLSLGAIAKRHGVAVGDLAKTQGVAISGLAKLQGVDVAAGGPSYLLEEGFEGTGYENSWTESGTGIDEDYATSPAPLAGSYSLFVDTGSTPYAYHDLGSGYASLYVKGVIRFTNAAASPGLRLVQIMASDNSTELGTMAQGTGGTVFRAHNGSTTANGSTTTLATGTTWYFWLEYTKGSGSDGVTKIYLNTTDSKPGTVEVEVTNGNASSDAQIVRLAAMNGTDVIYDSIIIDDSPIS